MTPEERVWKIVERCDLIPMEKLNACVQIIVAALAERDEEIEEWKQRCVRAQNDRLALRAQRDALVERAQKIMRGRASYETANLAEYEAEYERAYEFIQQVAAFAAGKGGRTDNG